MSTLPEETHSDSQAYTKMTAFLTGGDKSNGKSIKLPAKLMYILQCGDYEPIISWTLNGKSVIIKDTEMFVDTVLPTFFKQTKFDSFTRKMRRWKFSTRRIHTPKGVSCWAFEHPDFNKADGFATCDRVVTSDSQKEAVDPLRVAYGVVPASHGSRGTSQEHNSQQRSIPPPPRGLCFQTTSSEVVVEGQQTESQVPIVLAYRRQRLCSQDLLAQREVQTKRIVLPQGTVASSASSRPLMNSHTIAAVWPNVERSEVPPYLSLFRSDAAAVDITSGSARQIITLPSPDNANLSLLDFVANHAARRERRQLALGFLSSFYGHQGQQDCIEEENLVVQAFLNRSGYHG